MVGNRPWYQCEVLEPLIAVVSSVIAVCAAVIFSARWSPNVRLRIAPTWIVPGRKVLLRLSVENIGPVRVHKGHVRLVVAEHSVEDTQMLSEWVPFSANAAKENEMPRFIYGPEEIMETTRHLYPGEHIELDRLYTAGSSESEAVLLHVAIHFQSKNFGWLAPVFSWLAGVLGWAERWTTTAILHPAVPRIGA